MPPNPHLRIALLAALTALGSLAIHMFVPAMPSAAAELHTGDSEVQLALTLYLIGVGVGQIATGPISDRIGRRASLLAGALLFVAGSALCWWASSILWLLVGRVVQALGASSGLVAARASVGDTSGDRAASDMALLTAIVMLSPMLAPMLGSFIVHALGWRAVFAVLAVAGLFCSAAIFRWIPESASAPAARASVIADWHALVGNRHFLQSVAIAATASGALYVFLSAAPFLLIETYHAAPEALGILFGIVALGAGAGALTASRLARSAKPRVVIRMGAAISTAAGTVILVGVLLGSTHVAALVAPMAVVAFGGGLVTPNAMAEALASSPGRVGTAVSLYGALQMVASASATLLVVLLPSHDPWMPATAIAALALVSLLLARSHGPSGPPGPSPGVP